jgi:nitroreductase
MSFIEDLQWRYATKNMNGQSVSDEQLTNILAATKLAATSYGLQPFKVIVVGDAAIKVQLMAAAYGQTQVGSSSHVLVFAVPTHLTQGDIDAYIHDVVTTRGIPEVALAGFKSQMSGTLLALSAEQQQVWSAKQAYIALGTALAAAAEQRVDSCPMEGFDAAAFDKILGLTEQGYKAVVILPIGFRAASDATANYAKVRKSDADLLEFV